MHWGSPWRTLGSSQIGMGRVKGRRRLPLVQYSMKQGGFQVHHEMVSPMLTTSSSTEQPLLGFTILIAGYCVRGSPATDDQ
ncbi:hypothetical protein CONLIGDRAFT_126509 [Coniochaeta ligniaria NRRL 30616]|uniref:Uncharacterized protein n=1 Tax=Coniochaeta ligniaria NRRL 30616 TaxID=1408157 RepID=A0A1J7I6Y9_9PEZI|nr:hypothetical protein CONLIGDRAFT_126509 [Coniochaeta ligniaria NRRL 30616]